jgi:hypothetical protein
MTNFLQREGVWEGVPDFTEDDLNKFSGAKILRFCEISNSFLGEID